MATAGKKTAVSDEAPVASSETATGAVLASYEVLRRAALGRRGPDDGPSLGFTILLCQGMSAWLRAWAMCSRPVVPALRAAPLPDLPPLVHLELAHVWAHMALAHQEAVWT